MLLSSEEGKVAYRLLRSLDLYVDGQLKVLGLNGAADYQSQSPDDLQRLRNCRYDHPEIVDAYLRDNPDRLEPTDLSTVASWRQPVRGDFSILRHLKKGTLMLISKPQVRYFWVLGLTQPIEEACHGLPCPVYVRTALLPFRGRIIYDGLMGVYSIYPGPGARRHAREDAIQAVKQGLVHSSLDGPPAPPPQKKVRPRTDWRPILEPVVEATQNLKGGDTPFQGPAFALLRAAGQMGEAVLEDEVDVDSIRRQLTQARRAITRMETALYESYPGRN